MPTTPRPTVTVAPRLEEQALREETL